MSSYLSTHPQVLSLLQAAKERPEDDAPRMVLADWLEDQGDPDRAEFIRLQCRLAPGAPPLDPLVRGEIQARANRLLDRHGGAWLGSLWRFWLSPASWHRGLLSVGLPSGVELAAVSDVLPWVDTMLYRVSGRKAMERAVQTLTLTRVNHLILDLRQAWREARVLEWLSQFPESPGLRSLSWDWPVGLLRRQVSGEVDSPVATPAVSDGFLRRLLSGLALTRHLTHLGSMPAWSPEQSVLIRSVGVLPVASGQRVWMHLIPADNFHARRLSSPTS